MSDLADDLTGAVSNAVVAARFSGVVRIDRGADPQVRLAHGLADRAHGIAVRLDTQFATASASKGLTALTVLALVERGALALGTTARSLLGADLPLIAEDVTVEHLLAHRSGIGDYLDESTLGEVTDHVMAVPVHELRTASDFLPILDGHARAFPAGREYAYNNGAYVVLALLVERATGATFPDLVAELVTDPAGMVDTAYLPSDALPGRAARHYLFADGLRTNVLHLPVVGSGDGGAYATAADWQALWEALFAGRIIGPALLQRATTPSSDTGPGRSRFGLGLHLAATGDGVFLEGYDAGVSCATGHHPSTGVTWTVLSNWSEGAWPVIRAVTTLLQDR